MFIALKHSWWKVFWFLVLLRQETNCFFSLNSFHTLCNQVLGWWSLENTLGLPYTLKCFCLCHRSRLASTPPQTPIWGAQNDRGTNVYANLLLGAQKNVYQDFSFLKPWITPWKIAKLWNTLPLTESILDRVSG